MKRDGETSRNIACLLGLSDFIVGPGGSVCGYCNGEIAEGSTALRLRVGGEIYCGVTCADRHQSELTTEAGLEEAVSHVPDRQPAPAFDNREDLKAEVQKLLRRNRTIFETFGPFSSHDDPLTDAVDMWERKVIEDILPNNRRILKLLDANEGLLSSEERVVVERFRIHAEGFEYNHTSGDKNSSIPMFPREMNDLLR